MKMCFDITQVTLSPWKYIQMNFTEAQINHEIYLHDYFKVSFFIAGEYSCFKHFSLNQKAELEETIEIDFEDIKSKNFIL